MELLINEPAVIWHIYNFEYRKPLNYWHFSIPQKYARMFLSEKHQRGISSAGLLEKSQQQNTNSSHYACTFTAFVIEHIQGVYRIELLKSKAF